MQSLPLTYESLNSLPLWARMATITLDEMRGVKLMNRIDTKYVLAEDEVLTLLEHMAECGYRVQVINGVRACRYDTLYYDTALRDMYVAHHNRQLTRQKVRTRTYVETGLTFLEIKNKSNRGRTKKRRTEIVRDNFYSFAESAEASSFYKEHGGTIIMATHEETDLELCEQVLCLRDGRCHPIEKTLRGQALLKEIRFHDAENKDLVANRI